MKDIAISFSAMLDVVIPEEDIEPNLDSYHHWINEVRAYRENVSYGTLEYRCLSRLIDATIRIVSLRYGDFTELVPTLAYWMEAIELVNQLPAEPKDIPPARQIRDCLYELGGVIGGVDHQRELRYSMLLAEDFDAKIGRISDALEDLYADEDDEGDYEDWTEIESVLLPYRDHLEWALHAVRFIKLEFANWKILIDFDDCRVADKLTELDTKMRRTIKESNDRRWIDPDRNAPKSFWWRHLKPYDAKEDMSSPGGEQTK